MSKRSELLLPVGNMQMAAAAVHNGADAIYIGMPGFNARGRSHDHEWNDLKEIIDFCHLFGVKVHLAFNILIFQSEIKKAIETLDQAMKLSPDAFIVQDLGLVNLINKRYPKMTVHASTQMTVTNSDAISLLSDLDIERFVLGRENSIEEIKKIRSATDKELEVFVHGALCVAYSGQCFTSEALGGRSANRGQCAQSCRFSYELFVDDKRKDTKNLEYLVSPQDLCGIDHVPLLQDLGIESFKIEGRLKSPEFVATTAKQYAEKLKKPDSDTKGAKQKMQIAYSRGFYPGWLNGVAHQELVRGDYQNHRGLEIGSLNSIKANEVTITSSYPLQAGDGLLFTGALEPVGAKIFSIESNKKIGEESILTIKLLKSSELKKIQRGMKVFLNSSDQLRAEVKKSVQDQDQLKRIPIDINYKATLGQPLKLIASDGINIIELSSGSILEESKSRALTKEDLNQAFSKLGRSIYKLNSLEGVIESELFLNSKELKNLKNSMISELSKKRTELSPLSPIQDIEIQEFNNSSKAKAAKLTLLLRKASQLTYLLENTIEFDFIDKIILDFEFGKDYFSSVKLAKEKGIKIGIATTRILKPGEYHNFKLIERCNPDGILIRNLGALHYFKDSSFELWGDFSLNCANSETAKYLLGKGLQSICASYDMNIDELNLMLKHCDSSAVEITIHQYMPEFHMEHCVFAAFLSDGNSFRDCGKPCEKHEVYLKDMYGNRHEIKADQECRNTMFKAEANSTVKFIETWKELGVYAFRFECLHEEGHELLRKISLYCELLEGKIGTDDLYQKLGSIETYGLGVGMVAKKRTYQSRKKL